MNAEDPTKHDMLDNRELVQDLCIVHLDQGLIDLLLRVASSGHTRAGQNNMQGRGA